MATKKLTIPLTSEVEDGDQLPTLLTPRKRLMLERQLEASKKPEKTKLQDRRPGFQSQPLTLQPGLKFYSPAVEEIPDVPDPESRRHRAKTSKE
ncbi:unnamed protein product [Effrenium voratum]|nr:unnamed protein product [Effrenium voratum]|mmetsp:Transcript_121138/g.287785  ORF Transcript_121138/g.287785 Transcript_121138/m.287785 type:complete len:94 (+) Transcript_121138:73-354(+)